VVGGEGVHCDRHLGFGGQEARECITFGDLESKVRKRIKLGYSWPSDSSLDS
jgi:hypothetical protein